jgi:hypothetical protein
VSGSTYEIAINIGWRILTVGEMFRHHITRRVRIAGGRSRAFVLTLVLPQTPRQVDEKKNAKEQRLSSPGLNLCIHAPDVITATRERLLIRSWFRVAGGNRKQPTGAWRSATAIALDTRATPR